MKVSISQKNDGDDEVKMKMKMKMKMEMTKEDNDSMNFQISCLALNYRLISSSCLVVWATSFERASKSGRSTIDSHRRSS